MKELNQDIDESLLWQACFPAYFEYSRAKGFYTLRTEEQILTELQQGRHLADPMAEAEVRMELAMSQLWPHVKQEFYCDFFPHTLSAATDMLRAADFGRGEFAFLAPLVDELQQALDNCEQVACRLFGNRQAAEKDPKH